MKFEEEYSMANQNYAEVAKAILSANWWSREC